MRISDWSSDVCSSDLHQVYGGNVQNGHAYGFGLHLARELRQQSFHPLRQPGRHRHNRLHRRTRSAQVGMMVAIDHGLVVDRKSVVSGKSVSVRVDLGGRRSIKKKKAKIEKNGK